MTLLPSPAFIHYSLPLQREETGVKLPLTSTFSYDIYILMTPLSTDNTTQIKVYTGETGQVHRCPGINPKWWQDCCNFINCFLWLTSTGPWLENEGLWVWDQDMSSWLFCLHPPLLVSQKRWKDVVFRVNVAKGIKYVDLYYRHYIYKCRYIP